MLIAQAFASEVDQVIPPTATIQIHLRQPQTARPRADSLLLSGSCVCYHPADSHIWRLGADWASGKWGKTYNARRPRSRVAEGAELDSDRGRGGA